MTLPRFPLVAAGAAFAAMLVVLTLAMGTGRGGAPVAGDAGLAAGPDAPAPSATTDERIAILQATVRARPRRADGYTLLAGAYRQKVRETGDASYYTKAGGLVARALRLAPGDPAALTERAALSASRHDFRGALRDALAARRAALGGPPPVSRGARRGAPPPRRAAPEVEKPFGVLVDALVELGRYRAAGRALQTMVDRKPNLDSYARVSYFRELHGDLPGAASALRLAISAGGDVPENASYVRTLLGDLELVRGRPAPATRAYRAALAQGPRYAPAEFGLARGGGGPR